MTDDFELYAGTSHPDTSHEAMAKYPKGKMGKAVECVIGLYKENGPMADYVLKERFDASFGTNCCFNLYRQSRSIARDMGKIRDTGMRVVNPASGYKQIVWEYVDGPYAVLQQCPTCGHVLRRKAQIERVRAHDERS